MVTTEETREFVDGVFRKENDFVEVALRHVGKATPLFARLSKRHHQFRPAIQDEATRLVQFALLQASERMERPDSEGRTLRPLVSYLYGLPVSELRKRLIEYLDPDSHPAGEVFARNVWKTTMARRDFELFSVFSLHVSSMLNSLVAFFASVLDGMADDATGRFTALWGGSSR